MDTKFDISLFGQTVWEDRYALKDENGKRIENNVSETFRRVAKAIAAKEKDPAYWEEKFYEIMINRFFCPAGRILAHSGTHYSQLLNCFVLSFENDSLEAIMDTAKNTAIIQKYGGGVGINYSVLRPSASFIKGVNGRSCGVLGFINMMSTVSEVIEQGGSRRGANMGILEVWHPDVWEYISYKTEHNWDRLKDFMEVKDEEKWAAFKFENTYKLQMYNVSIGVTDEFLTAVKENKDWSLKWKNEEWELYTVVFKKYVSEGVYRELSFEATANCDSAAIWKVKKKIPFPSGKDIFEVVSKRKIKATEIWNKICYNAWADGCPGVINFTTARKYHNLEYISPLEATNPCLHGDTLVAVADGRVAVSIRQLSEEQKDVPVYCRKEDGKIAVRMMRNPRITGYNQKILKVTIENGHVLRVTEAHKFVLSDGSVKEAKDLKSNDSLSIMNKLKAPFDKVLKQCDSDSKNYYWIKPTGYKTYVLDHRLIYDFYHLNKLSSQDVVHHEDKNGLNNTRENLKKMEKKKHDLMHASDKIGDKNPMRRAQLEWSEEDWLQYSENMSESVSGEKNGRYGGVSNEDLFKTAVDHTKKIGRKITTPEWQKYALKNNLPSQFSRFRVDNLGKVTQFLEKAAIEAGVLGSEHNNALLREYKNFLKIKEETDLNVFFDEGIKVKKNCEWCGCVFIVPYYRREQCFCSLKCSSHKKRNMDGIRQRYSEIMVERRTQQIDAFNDLKIQLGRLPFKKELSVYCKSKGIPFRLPTIRERNEKNIKGTFCGYKELKEAALSHNHRVVSVECDGLDTVYNGTVDEYHNFYVGHFEEMVNGCPNYVYINNMQCGEQFLSSKASCNLSSIILSSFVKGHAVDYQKIKEVIRTAVRFADNVIDVCQFPIPGIKETATNERRVGIGTMAGHDLLIKLGLPYDSDAGRGVIESILETIRDEAYRASIELAKEKGSFPLFNKEKYLQNEYIKTLPKDIQEGIEKYGIRNSLLLSQAPSGTISTLYSVSTGCEPWFSLNFQRNTRLGSFEDGCPMYIEWRKTHPNEEKPAYFKTAQEISPEDHIKMLILFSRYIDSSVSKTVNLANSATVEGISKAFFMAMDNGAKGITVFRDGSKSGVFISKDKKTDIIKDAKKQVAELQHIKEDDNGDSRVAPKKRGNTTFGTTTRVHMQNRNLYVTVNRNEKNEFVEVFATVGEDKKMSPHHTSGVEDSWAEGLAKTISLALRAGVQMNSIIRNLKNIPSDKPVFSTIGLCETSELISSPPHAIARVMEESLILQEKAIEALSIPAPDFCRGSEEKKTVGEKACEECGSVHTKRKSSTCYECIDCGYSGCS